MIIVRLSWYILVYIFPITEDVSFFADMSSTAFIEPLPVIDFVTQLLNRDVLSRPLSDADRVKVCFLIFNLNIDECYSLYAVIIFIL